MKIQNIASFNDWDTELNGGVYAGNHGDLTYSRSLSLAARDLIIDFDQNDSFGHTDSSGQGPSDRAQKYCEGNCYVGENLALSYDGYSVD